jgi:hypothetical protein
MSASSPTPRNIHGRQGGRGLRPYLIFPKSVFVSVFLGGLVSLLVLAFLQRTPTTLEEWRHRASLVAVSYVFVVVPGLLGGMIVGLILLFSHFRAFIQMRWLQLKLVLIAVCVPSLHFYMRGKATQLHNILDRNESGDLERAAELWLELRNGTLAAILFALIVIFLGRIKPRLGQNYVRTSSRSASSPLSSAEQETTPSKR